MWVSTGGRSHFHALIQRSLGRQHWCRRRRTRDTCFWRLTSHAWDSNIA
jgi:hypothetical protein